MENIENIMLEYIFEEPKYLQTLLDNREEITHDFTEFFLTHPVKRVYFSASGTPHYASVVIQYFIMKLLHVEATSTVPMLFNNHEEFNVNGVYKTNEMVLICPAHSGRTKGPVDTARKARAMGIPVICTTLNPDGILAKECDVIIKKISGIEKSFPESKGHFVTIATLMICVLETAFALKKITQEEYQCYYRDMYKLITSCKNAINQTMKWYETNKEILLNAEKIFFIGYGANYATVQEAALKWGESNNKMCQAHELEEFMHGPDISFDKKSVIFYVCAEPGREQDRMLLLKKWAEDWCDYNILVTNTENMKKDQLSLTANFVDAEFLSCLEYLIPFQILAHMVARDLGLSTVNSRNGSNYKYLDTKYDIELKE